MTTTTYKFDYAVKRLRDAIDYAEQTGEFQQVRKWVNEVEAAYYDDTTTDELEAQRLDEISEEMNRRPESCF